MKNVFLIVFSAFFLWSCAAKPKVAPNLPLLKAAEPLVLETSDPADFEKSMPSSAILRKSLIIFDNTYIRVYSDNGVAAAAAGSKMTAVLKPEELGLTLPFCSALALDEEFDNLKVAEYEAIIYNKSRVDIFSGEECARMGSYKKILNGRADLAGSHVVEWEGTKAVLREAYSGKVLYNGDTGLEIAAVGMIDGKIALIHANGYVMTYNEDLKAFSLHGSFPVKFDKLYFAEGVFYGVTVEKGEFFVITGSLSDVLPYENCALSPSSPYALCGGYLTGKEARYAAVPAAPDFSAGMGLYLTLKNGNLNIYSLKNAWQRFVSFDYLLPEPCLSSEGAVYFTSFSGALMKIFKGAETFSQKKPSSCDPKAITMKGGEFFCGGKPCGKFAEIVNSDSKGVMLRRIENGKRYYFFEER